MTTATSDDDRTMTLVEAGIGGGGGGCGRRMRGGTPLEEASKAPVGRATEREWRIVVCRVSPAVLYSTLVYWLRETSRANRLALEVISCSTFYSTLAIILPSV